MGGHQQDARCPDWRGRFSMPVPARTLPLFIWLSCEPSVGSVGNSYDSALAETINGLYKAELIHRRARGVIRGSPLRSLRRHVVMSKLALNKG